MSNTEQTNLENRISNEQLAVRIQAGEDVAENMLQLWQQSERFIASLAMRYQGYAELDDLKQEGYIGLCEAVRQYDQEQGASFIHYAGFRIRQAMKRYIDNCCSTVRIPVHAGEWIQKYHRAVKEYRKHYGTEPPERALCAMLKVSREKLHSIQKDAGMSRIDSLNRPISGEDEDITIADTVACSVDIEDKIIKKLDDEAMKRELWLAVDELPDDLPAVLRFRYIDRKTLKEVGQSLGVSLNRARDLESKAIRKLSAKGARRFRGYYEEYLRAAPIRHVGVESFRRTWTSSVEREVLREYRW